MEQSPGHEEQVYFDSERTTGRTLLEGMLCRPYSDTHLPGAVLCHPHPMGGGDMDVPLIARISQVLCAIGYAVLRFNFGGVGASRGVFTDGDQEPYDVEAAVNYLRDLPIVDEKQVGLAGWSFGAWMALVAVSEGIPAMSVVAIAPPLPVYDWQPVARRLGQVAVPRHYVLGSRDRFCPVSTLEEFTSAVSPGDREHMTILEGTDHFFFTREAEVAGLVVELISET